MACFACGRRSAFSELSRAAAKLAGDRLRRIGALHVHPQWPQRTAVCQACTLRVVHNGVDYCGTPLLSRIRRSPAEGCGCPVSAKAKDPAEHCPLAVQNSAVRPGAGRCACKWCDASCG